ncbi:MAG: VWA domain-containing protein [Gammaproteobacteria bacterium]|nr:VWA domain-containing protein [Gammaproteobacteria bacterium]
MLDFDWWFALLLLPLPFFVRKLMAPAERAELAITVPLLARYGDLHPTRQQAGSRFGGLCLWAFWIALVIAASRPFWLGDPVTRTVSGRDLMLAVDISGSMSEADMTIDSRIASRIDVLKLVVENFIDRRGGDRLGLILFGTNAYTYVPLTFDLEALKELLQDISTGLAGRHTAIGDAIGVALKSMREQQAEHKVLVLITDGSNTAGFENPVLVAAAARQHGLTIYTIGVGSDAESLGRIYRSQNVPAGIALNENLLRRIADVSGGRYFRATNAARLEQIYQDLDQLEPVEHKYQSQRPRSELFVWPLSAALLVLAALIVGSMLNSYRSGPR